MSVGTPVGARPTAAFNGRVVLGPLSGAHPTAAVAVCGVLYVAWGCQLFDVNLTEKEQQQLFFIMDTDGDSELGFPEFVMFLFTVKQIDTLYKDDPKLKTQVPKTSSRGPNTDRPNRDC